MDVHSVVLNILWITLNLSLELKQILYPYFLIVGFTYFINRKMVKLLSTVLDDKINSFRM